MVKFAAAVALALSITCLTSAQASAQQAGQVGAGVILGRPTGLTGKMWLTGSQALDLGFGFSDDVALYADYLWHAWDLFPPVSSGKLGGYVGLGPRLDFDRDTEFAIRTIAGLDYWVERRPIELFLEAGPVFRLTPDTGVEIDAGVGVRFYFR